MATVAPTVEYRQLAGKSTLPLRHDIICVHTMVGTLEGSIAWSARGGGSYWHFGIAGNGRTVQTQDLRYRAAANLEGNPYCISIETADRNEGIFPLWSGSDVPAWTAAQVNKLVDLCTWLCRTYNIPPVLVPDSKPGRRGLAYHRQGIDPWRVPGGDRWSSSTGKVCPGDRRIHQFVNTVIPQVARRVGGTTTGDWLDMATKEEVEAAVYKQVVHALRQAVGPDDGNTPAGFYFDSLAEKVKNIEGRVDPGRVRTLAQEAVENVLKVYATKKTSPLHDIVRQVVEGVTPAPPS